MLQDVVFFKKQLVRLRRLLQEVSFHFCYQLYVFVYFIVQLFYNIYYIYRFLCSIKWFIKTYCLLMIFMFITACTKTQKVLVSTKND